MSIYRQTGSGVSSVIDAYGRTTQRLDIFQTGNTGNFIGRAGFGVVLEAKQDFSPCGSRIGFGLTLTAQLSIL